MEPIITVCEGVYRIALLRTCELRLGIDLEAGFALLNLESVRIVQFA